VRLAVDGYTLVQPFEILPNPQLSGPQEDLQAQFDLLVVVLDKLARTNELINQIAALEQQASTWEQRLAGFGDAVAIRERIHELRRVLAAMKPPLIDVNMRQAQLHPSGLHERLNALFDAIDGADYAPTKQARDVLATLAGQVDAAAERFRQVLAGQVPAINTTLQQVGIPPLGVTRTRDVPAPAPAGPPKD
jgi:hypothetical protein